MMNDKYKVLICSVWAVLITYCIIKVFNGNYFELFTNFKSFIAVSNFIEEHLIFRKILFALLSAFSGYFVICAIMKEKYLNWWKSLIFISLMIFKSLIQWKFKLFGYLLDFVILIFLPMLLMENKKIITRILRPFAGYGLIFVFQVLSMFLANIALFKFTALHTLDQLLYTGEYYFGVILYYLYSNKKLNKKKEVK